MSPLVPPSLLQVLRPTSPECIDKIMNDRHFVTWTDREDEILRQAVTTYGIDKWSAIAAKFTNKTSRQCRRRWYTHLVTDCRKGGWSPEEDQLLLEAQRRFGNRWTEIAKMVPGRTDNAVKNRFSALGKKQAKKPSMCNDCGADAKAMPKRKVLEQNCNIINKRTRGDYTAFLSSDYNVQQLRQPHVPAKHSLQLWTADQSMADRAHPVHNDKTCKEALPSSTSRALEDLRVPEYKRVVKCAGALPVNRYISNQGPGTFQTPQSFPEKVLPHRLEALTQNAALLDSLVERHDASVKSLDYWFTMEGSGKILQPANFTCKDGNFGDIRTCMYEGKENYNAYSQIYSERQISGVVPTSQESVSQPNHPQEFATATPTIQHERVWKVRSNVERLECSSPSDDISCHAEASTSLHTDSYSSFSGDQPLPTELNEMEPGVACQTQCQDAVDDYKPLATDLPWDSRFFLDDVPSPQFSDSEKQFLLTALDSSYQTAMLESHLLGGNVSMASFCK